MSLWFASGQFWFWYVDERFNDISRTDGVRTISRSGNEDLK